VKILLEKGVKEKLIARISYCYDWNEPFFSLGQTFDGSGKRA
jgi:hypothetical protein